MSDGTGVIRVGQSPPPEITSKKQSIRYLQKAGIRGAKFIALVFFLSFFSAPALTATCEPLQRGTLSDDGTFTRGSTDSDFDYRVVCPGIGPDDMVTKTILESSRTQSGADPFLASHEDNPNTEVLVEISNAVFHWSEEDGGSLSFVVTGSLDSDADGGSGISLMTMSGATATNYDLESRATVTTDGQGARGILVFTSEGDVNVRNLGSVTTTGDSYLRSTSERRSSDGVFSGTDSGNAEAVNEASAVIRTAGTGSRGLYAYTRSSGTARTVNRGSVTTTGDVFSWTDADSNTRQRAAHTVYALSNGGGTAQAINEANAMIRTDGDGARGLYAWVNGRGTATATNRGTVTTTGDTSTLSTVGVYAGSDGGTAQAINEVGATITTGGLGSRGLAAINEGATGRADAVNRGDIITTGADYSTRVSSGVSVYSEENSASVVNHLGASITTGGTAARGISVSTARGGTDDTASATNFGMIMTSGDGGAVESGVDGTAAGIGVFSSSGASATAEAVNAASGVIITTGAGARGIVVSAIDSGQARGTNRGSITTRGDAHLIDLTGTENDGWRGAHGLFAFSTSASEVTATNDDGGTIDTHGTAASGLAAYTSGAGGQARAVNRGRVRTHQTAAASNLPGESRSIGSRGVYVYSRSGNAIIENEATGQVETIGAQAFGLLAITDNDGSQSSAMAEVRNRGRTTTRGANADGAVALARNGGSEANPNHARAYNLREATIITEGDNAGGLTASVFVSGGGSMTAYGSALAQNDGTVMTSGGDSDGPRSEAATGVTAQFYSPDGTTIAEAGDVTVINSGDVTVSGAGATGLWTDTYGTGSATVTMTGGSVTATHATGVGIRAKTETGKAIVTLGGGSVVTAATDDPDTTTNEGGGIGILVETAPGSTMHSETRITGGSVVTATTAARFLGGPAVVQVVDSTLTGDIEFGDLDDSLTIDAQSTITGDIDFGDGDDTFTTLTLSGNRGVITGDIDFGGGIDTFDSREAFFTGSLNFGGGNDRFRTQCDVFIGNIDLGSGDDMLTITERGVFAGNIEFGEGDDMLMFDVTGTDELASEIEGTITGLETMMKLGPGTARVRDVTFAGSTLTIEDGGLVIAGHLDLGATPTTMEDSSTLIIKDAGRLIFEVGDIDTDPTDHGSVTAGGGIVLEGISVIGIQLASDVENAEDVRVALEETDIDLTGDNTDFMMMDGTGMLTRTNPMVENKDGIVVGNTDMDGSASIDRSSDIPVTPVILQFAPPSPSGGGGGDNNLTLYASIGGGLSAIAIASLFTIFDFDIFGSEEPEEEEEDASKTSFAGLRFNQAQEHRVRDGGVEYWSRSFAGSAAPALGGGAEADVQGYALGMNTNLGGGFSFGFSAMPEVAVSSRGGSTPRGTSGLAGSRYAVQGGWSDGDFFARASLSHGDYRAHSVFENPAVGGMLSGSFGMAQNNAQLGAGMRLNLGRLQATPSVSWFYGSETQNAYTAEDATLRADVPAISRRYQGLRAGLSLAPTSWLKGPKSLRWLPSLRFSAQQTYTDALADFALRQSDKAGVLSFASNARVSELPRTIVGVSAGLTAMKSKSDSWRLRMGYAGTVVDGEPDHAVLARLNYRF